MEKDMENNYWLKYGYGQYLAYKEVLPIHQKIPCIVKSFTSETQQRIDLLKNMFLNQSPTAWGDKNALINQLLDMGRSKGDIAKQVGISIEELEKYLLHPDIPQRYLEEADRNNASYITMDNIRKLDIPYSH
ncbi:MAG: hypothetical protein LRY73_07560 [Bacillus sp. (in: Bacteria)]|nr:hypothetical protein [Bacillus sp. (in: firmicutes)]